MNETEQMERQRNRANGERKTARNNRKNKFDAKTENRQAIDGVLLEDYPENSLRKIQHQFSLCENNR